MVLVEPRQIASTRIPTRDIDEGGWLATEATALSGADVQTWRGDLSEIRYPLIPGRQVVGRIAVPHPGIDLEVGTRVVVEPSIRCGKCKGCDLGLASCSRRQPFNSYGLISSVVPPGLWGGLAEYLYLDPAARLHEISDDVSAEMATFAHPLASGHTWAVEIPRLTPGDRVLILGPGPRGLACLLAAKAGGASWVGITGLSHDEDRLAMARYLGADLTVDIETEDPAQAVAEDLGTRPDIVIDVTSHDPEAVFTALDLVRSGGRVVLASTKGNRALHFFTDVIVTKQLSINGAVGASNSAYKWACRQLEEDPRIDKLVSHQFPLSEAQRAMHATAGLLGHDELISVAVTF